MKVVVRGGPELVRSAVEDWGGGESEVMKWGVVLLSWRWRPVGPEERGRGVGELPAHWSYVEGAGEGG